jgi:hypothetical protein
MPFTVTTIANLKQDNIGVDRSIDGASTNLVGSHLNVLDSSTAFSEYDYIYWFSNLLQENGIKLCIGGHKHTYAVTYPVADLNLADNNVSIVDDHYHFSKKTKIKRPRVPEGSYSNIDTGLW